VLYVCYVYAVTSGGEEEKSAAEDNSRKEKTFAWNVCYSVEVFVNLWSNNKKLMTNNERLVNYGADLLRLSKLSP
jgi:hypothetical protein